MKKKVSSFERHVKFIATNEDWYPTFLPLEHCENVEYCNPRPYLCARVTVSEVNGWHITVDGADDHLIQKWGFNTREECLELFELITDYTTRKDLEELGFEVA